MHKKLLWLLLPVLAVGAPPVLYNAGNWWTRARERVMPLLSLRGGPEVGTAPAAPGAPANSAPSERNASGSADPRAGPAGSLAASENRPPPVDLAEALRFDVTPGWVMDRWPWVSAGLSQLLLQGYRVPLVTGTAEDDLAGSLTYYFNARQQVARITFQGTTGDAGRLIRLLMSRYGFGRRLTNNPGLFRYELPVDKGPAKSFLDLRLAQPKDPYRRFDVALVLERPE